MEGKKDLKLDREWKTPDIASKYEFTEFLGEGTYGQVVKARCKKTGQIYAVKLIKNIFKCVYQARLTYREIFILRKLSEIEENIFTTKLVDIIYPKQFQPETGSAKQDAEMDDGSHKHVNLPSSTSMMKITFVFIVMEYVQTDFRKLLNSTPKTQLKEEHIITILYNQLCALNFLHTANIVHRDLKPGNFLIDSTCNVKVCDFGLARVQANTLAVDRDLKKLQKELYKYAQQSSSAKERKSRLNEFKDLMTQSLLDTKDQREKTPRDISSVIMSRWYRAPEVVLTFPHYGQGCDIWSLGCIAAELIFCCSTYSTLPNFDNRRRFIFQGDSCFPISPAKGLKRTEKNESVSANDQIIKICQRFRNQDAGDYSYISDKVIKEYMGNIQKKAMEAPDYTVRELFPNTSDKLVTLVEDMLIQNPYLRPTAKQLLSHPIFNEIRQEELEKPAPFKFVISADRNDDLKQDYSKQEEIQWVDFSDESKIPDKILYFQKMIIKEAEKLSKSK